jgi:hypothetical protein
MHGGKMSEEIKCLLEELAELDRDVAEAVELALAYGEDGEPVIGRMLERRLQGLINSECCYERGFEVPGDPITGEEDYDNDGPCSCPVCTDPPGEVEPGKTEEEIELDELSERLGIDVGLAEPLELAVAIIKAAPGDEVQQTLFIQRLGRCGRNMAQLTALVEDL